MIGALLIFIGITAAPMGAALVAICVDLWIDDLVHAVTFY